jgi:type II secretory pathway component PulF
MFTCYQCQLQVIFESFNFIMPILITMISFVMEGFVNIIIISPLYVNVISQAYSGLYFTGNNKDRALLVIRYPFTGNGRSGHSE